MNPIAISGHARLLLPPHRILKWLGLIGRNTGIALSRAPHQSGPVTALLNVEGKHKPVLNKFSLRLSAQ
jgi:hypothetical protein